MSVKLLPVGTKEIEEGLYSLRATGLAPDGGVETVYSQTYIVRNVQELREHQADWLDKLADRGYTKLQVKAILCHERPRWFGSSLQGQTIKVALQNSFVGITAYNGSDKLQLTLSELNGEFILDI